MPKVELNKIVIGESPISGEVYIGTVSSGRIPIWRSKRNFLNEFLDVVIKKWENQKEIVTCGTHQWEISVRKIK